MFKFFLSLSFFLRYNNILYVYGSTDVRLHCNSNVCHMKVSRYVSGGADISTDGSQDLIFLPSFLGPFVCHFRVSRLRRFFFFFSFFSFPPSIRMKRFAIIAKFDRSARDQRPVSADLVFIIINLFFIFGKLGPSRDPSRESYSSAAGIQCLETPTRVMLLVGVPASNTSTL